MSEAIISRRGYGTSGGSSDYYLKTELIDVSQDWIVPQSQNNLFSVRIFGAGMSGSSTLGGGGGYGNGGNGNNNRSADGGYGAGGGGGIDVSIFVGSGGNGICIIQYMTKG